MDCHLSFARRGWLGELSPSTCRRRKLVEPDLGAGPGDDAQDLPRLHVAPCPRAGARRSPTICSAVQLGAQDGMQHPTAGSCDGSHFHAGESEDLRPRTVLRELARSGPGLGEDGDGADVQVLGGMGHRFANGFGDREPRHDHVGEHRSCQSKTRILVSVSSTILAIILTASTG